MKKIVINFRKLAWHALFFVLLACVSMAIALVAMMASVMTFFIFSYPIEEKYVLQIIFGVVTLIIFAVGFNDACRMADKHS